MIYLHFSRFSDCFSLNFCAHNKKQIENPKFSSARVDTRGVMGLGAMAVAAAAVAIALAHATSAETLPSATLVATIPASGLQMGANSVLSSKGYVTEQTVRMPLRLCAAPPERRVCVLSSMGPIRALRAFMVFLTL